MMASAKKKIKKKATRKKGWMTRRKKMKRSLPISNLSNKAVSNKNPKSSTTSSRSWRLETSSIFHHYRSQPTSKSTTLSWATDSTRLPCLAFRSILWKILANCTLRPNGRKIVARMSSTRRVLRIFRKIRKNNRRRMVIRRRRKLRMNRKRPRRARPKPYSKSWSQLRSSSRRLLSSSRLSWRIYKPSWHSLMINLKNGSSRGSEMRLKWAGSSSLGTWRTISLLKRRDLSTTP